MKYPVLILGATSPIARAASFAFAKEGYPLILAARDCEENEKIANDISIRFGVNVKRLDFDAKLTETHLEFMQKASENGLSGVLLAFGDLGDQKLAQTDLVEMQKIFQINCMGACSVLTHLANFFEEQKSGFIIGIGSVAGDRGRQSNYVYGAAKAGFSTFLQGLRNRLHPHGVRVLTVKPGFVDTKMTFGKPGLFLVADPNHVGEMIVKALNKKKDTVYLPWFWRPIMLLIKSIPERIFKRLKL